MPFRNITVRNMLNRNNTHSSSSGRRRLNRNNTHSSSSDRRMLNRNNTHSNRTRAGIRAGLKNNGSMNNDSSTLKNGSACGKSIAPGTGSLITETGSNVADTTATKFHKSATTDTSV